MTDGSEAFAPIDTVLDELRAGRMVVLTDDEDRENEGDLVLPAQFATPEAITFMLSVARGYLCVSLTGGDCERLNLHPQSPVNTSARGTPFTVSVDGHPKHGFTTGVSAAERARTIRMLIDPATTPEDFVRPGHINPLRARDGGVLVRTGQTEGSVDLCRLAGLYPAALIIEIMRDDGEMARVPDLIGLCREHGLKMCSVAQIIEHRLGRQSLVRRAEPVEGAAVDTPDGRFTLLAFESLVDPQPHLALTVGGVGRLSGGEVVETTEPTLVRMHRRDLLGDIFGCSSGGRPSTGAQLRAGMRAIQEAGRGAVVYLRPEGAGDASALSSRLTSIRRPTPEPGADTPDLTRPDGSEANVPMDLRSFGVGGQILRQLGLHRLRLLTNSSRHLPGLEAYGLEIVERVPLEGDRG